MSPSNPLRPSDEEIRARKAALLLAEIRNTDAKRAWYYISIQRSKGGFDGVFIHAFGPTDAWDLVHRLNLYRRGLDENTSTMGPIADENIAHVPENKRWVRLSLAEVNAMKPPQPPTFNPSSN